MANKGILPGLKEKLSEPGCFSNIIGQDSAKRQVSSAMIAGHHIIIIGSPGVGKTTLAKNIASLLPEIEVMDCQFNCLPESPVCPSCISGKPGAKKRISGPERFIRIQGSPDLTVEDILGDIDPIKALKFGPSSIEAFTPGKIFRANNGILFFDEVNRCPEKLQNALLQVLEEGKATLGGYMLELPANFIFIGTMNPEDSSTEKLSDVFLDRFDVVYMGYPEDDKTEKEIVMSKAKREDVEFPENELNFMISFISSLRNDEKLEKRPSVRATICLFERVQANAIIRGKKKVQTEDIAQSVISVLSHRIRLKPSFKFLQEPSEYVGERFREHMKSELYHSKRGGDP